MRAAALGLGLVLIFMIGVYRLPGFLADVALAVYVLVMMAILALSHATLTLPGIAGFVLSIGMAVDANVLIFERIKEELWNGKTMRAAVRVGFQRAFSAVFDSHFTTIVGAGVLYMLGTGTVKGFAFTLFWGTVVSLVTAVFITRFFVDVLVDNEILTAPELYGVKRSELGDLRQARRSGGVAGTHVISPAELEYRRLVPHRLDDLVPRHRDRFWRDDLSRFRRRQWFPAFAYAAPRPFVYGRHRHHGEVHAADHARYGESGALEDRPYRRIGHDRRHRRQRLRHSNADRVRQ